MNPVRKTLMGLIVALLLVATLTTEATANGSLTTNVERGRVETAELHTAALSSELTTASINNAFESLNPARILDTRAGSTTIDGNFAATGPLPAGDSFELVVVGRGGVPSQAVGAVAINVTAVAPTGSGFLTVWPTGSPMPNASNINFAARDVVPNLVIVRVGTAGKVNIFNETGSTHLVVDVVGWFSDNAGLQPLVPARLLDTRPGSATIDGVAAGGGAIVGDATASLIVTGRGGVPAVGVGTVVLNVTVTAPSDAGYVTAWPSGATRPNASNLNFVPGQTVANLVITKVGSDGRVNLYNSSGATHLIVDVMGWFAADSELHSLLPARLLDTRPGGATIDGQSAGGPPIGPNASRSLLVTGRGGVPSTGVAAVVLNVTVTAPSTASFLTVWPTAFLRPNASSLNYTAGKTVANMVIARVGIGGSVSFYNSLGTTHVIADVVGWLPPNEPLNLTEFNLLPGIAGQAYSHSIGISGSQMPYTFTSSGVAAGLTMSTAGAITGTPSKPGTSSTQFSVTDRFGRGGSAVMPHNIFPSSSNFIAVTPTTLLDTFSDPVPVSAGEMRTFNVGGVAGVPASGVVPVLSVAALSYASGYITFFASDQFQPPSGQLTLTDFSFVNDIEVIPMSASGQITVHSFEDADLQVDVIGYMALGASFAPVAPQRIVDTRFNTRFAAGEQRDVGVPATATDALAIVTVADTTGPGTLAVWDSGTAVPNAPTMRWQDRNFSQFVVIHLGTNGKLSIKNTSGAVSTHVLVDIVGYFT